jgi:hypothetical protein
VTRKKLTSAGLRAKAGDLEFDASLGNTVSSRPTWATLGYSISKNQRAGRWRLTPGILATQEAKISRITSSKPVQATSS